MEIAVLAPRDSARIASEIEAATKELGIGYEIVSLEDLEGLSDDVLVVVGEDRDLLRALHRLGEREIPVMCVSPKGAEGFFMEASLEEFEWALERLARGEYRLERCTRLEALVDGRKLSYAPNEVAVFPGRSATLMEYELWIDGEYAWRDCADGVIVATPVGSTAYSMSAGGPMVLPQARALVVTPVNSLDLTRRPLVVHDTASIEITGIYSRCDVEAVADGLARTKVEGSVVIRKASADALLVRLEREEPGIYGRLKRKLKIAEELAKMPPSAKLVLKVLEYEGPLTQHDIARKTLLPPRTIRYALSMLLERGIVGKIPNIRDARQDLYYIRLREESEGGRG